VFLRRRADLGHQESPRALMDDYEGHPSVRTLISEGYEVVTF
jgi:hypothetical protein